MNPTRRTVLVLITTTALLLGVLTGCGGGAPKPDEGDLLPETGLTYPGATESVSYSRTAAGWSHQCTVNTYPDRLVVTCFMA